MQKSAMREKMEKKWLPPTTAEAIFLRGLFFLAGRAK